MLFLYMKFIVIESRNLEGQTEFFITINKEQVINFVASLNE